MKGLLGGMVMTSWFIFFVNVYLVHKHIGYSFWLQIKDLLPTLLMAISAMIIAYLIGLLLPSFHMYVVGIIRLLVFSLVYFGGSILFKMESYTYVRQSMPQFLGRFKKKTNNKKNNE